MVSAKTTHMVQSTDTYEGPELQGRPRRTAMRRLNLNLTESLYEEISQLADSEGRTMTEVVRIGLGLARLAIDEQRKGGQLAVVDAAGQLHRIILPR